MALAVLLAIGYGHLTQLLGERLLLGVAALLVVVWGVSRWMLERRVHWLRTAMQRAGKGELGVRLAAMGEPAWDAIAEAFNSTMTKLERDRELLSLRETELQQRNATLLALREALDSHAIVAVTAANGDIVFANDRFCRISGYAAEELLGRNHRILKSGAHDPAFYREMWSTISAGRAWHGVIENRRKDGSHYWVQSSILPVLDAQGVPRQYISIRTDISSRERLRKGLEILACAEHGQALFASLVQGLSVGLDARWTGLSRLCGDGATLEVVACWDAGAPGDPFRYAAAGAPCELAMATNGEFVVGSDLRAQFPQALALATLNAESYRGLVVSDYRGRPIGVLWAMSERPAEADAGAAALLAVAAKRAAAELARLGVEGELRDKDKRLETVIEGAGLAVWDWEIQSDRIDVNERWAAMLGHAADKEPKRLDDWRRMVHPEDVAHVETALQRHLDGETPAFSAELRLRGRDGRWVWILDSGRVTSRDAAGRPLRATGIHLDITERKHAEQALAAERSRLELVLRAGRIGFWDWDVRSGAIDTNDVVRISFGAVASGFRSMREWFALIHPDDRLEFVSASRACLDGRQTSFRQISRWRTERGWVWLRTQSQVTARDADGRALRMMGVHIDIDEQRRAEERIREQEERLRLVVDCAALGIWDWDMVTGRVESNERLAQMLGYEPGELQTQASLAALAHPDDVALLNDATRAHLQGRSPFLSAEVRLRGRDGQWMWILSRGRIARRDAQGRAVRMAGIHFDVTERHVAALERDRLQAQLQQAQKMEALGQLTGGIAHDFNNILASILGYASLAHSRYAGDNPKLAEYLAAVITAGERARDLIAKMLVFSRDTPRESGSSMDVAALVREVATLLASVIPSSITIAVDVAADVPRAQLGATDLHQVLVNLAVNARDAMGESGRLDITVAAVRCARQVCSTCHELVDGDYVEIVCRDTGSGMDEPLLKRVFEPFFTTKEVGKGTGMGLAVVHGIVHRAGGHILVASTPGVGTTFRLLLPPALAQVDDTQVLMSSSPAPRRAQARSGRILVVDDEAMIAAYLRELLERQGHEVAVVHDGQAALALLRERPQDFDLVITDQTMPKLSGVGLVKALRTIRADLPAVLCTGFSDVIDLRGARALGVRRFLRKPIEAQTMLRVVSELLEAAPALPRAVDDPLANPRS